MQRPMLQMEIERGLDVIQNAQRNEEPDVLEGARYALAGDCIGLQSVKPFTTQKNLSFGRWIDPSHHIKDCRLSRPVWADQTDELPAPHFHGEIGDSGQAAEPDRAPVQFEEAIHPSLSIG